MDLKLYKIAKNGSPNFLNNLFDVDSKHQVTFEKNTILHIAAKSGNKQSTDQILKSYPFLVHHVNTKGETPLHIAARLGHFDVARLLVTYAKQQRVEESGNIRPLRIVSKKKLTVLHEAAKNDHLDVVDLLIEEDPGLTFTTDDAVESPLFMAVERRFYQVALRILETFPDCSCSGRNGMTIMHAAVLGLPPDFVNKVLEKTGPGILEEEDSFGWTPLHYAAYIGNRDVVKLFLETNSSLAYTKNNEGMSALHIAAQRGSCTPVIETLIQKCPDVSELLDNKGQTALHVAVANGNQYTLSKLLGMMPFNDLLNEPNKDGNTCLHVAALQGYDKIVLRLLNDRRVDQAAINNLGMTAADIDNSRKKHSKFLIIRKGVHHKSLERRVIQESRMAQLDRKNLLETTQETKLEVPSQDDQPAGPSDTSITTAQETKLEVPSQDDQPAGASDTSITTAQENEKSILAEHIPNLSTINLLVATIIAGITFSSFVQMPGGYNNDGMPILRNFKTFKTFLLFDSLAFGLSAASICLHFATPVFALLSGTKILYPLGLSFLLTCLSICFTLVAFVSARSAVLNEKSNFKYDDLAPFLFSFVLPLFLSILFYIDWVYRFTRHAYPFVSR
ncbi:hypothetical protein UlMin_007040 [Ulmus minor]